ncbi:50S ribosomal protein L18 [Bacteroidetes/Chlorobi group bacterium ChocPot_Mid]|jgi:large subunit ribosomal protein L18|nr:MAG: 50S ribosomal protein L18 [Bacteroidetes/Chlorobi group bacterium ChocPot_Mid]
MSKKDIKLERRLRRKMHIRKHLQGRDPRPRLTVYRSLNEIYAQIIDDKEAKTLVSASSIDKELREKTKSGVKKIEKSKMVGQLLAKRAIEKDIKSIAFDRNGYLYHGRVKALADAAREAGLQF